MTDNRSGYERSAGALSKRCRVAALAFALIVVLAGAAGAAEGLIVPDAEAVTSEGLPARHAGLALHSSGVGIYVDEAGVFVTPFHVAGHCAALLVARPDGFAPADPLADDPLRDLTILRTAPTGARAVLRLAEGEGAAAPQKMVRYAHLQGLSSYEVLGAKAPATGDGTVYEVRTSKPILGGDSGSPVILRDGSVGGLIAAVAAGDSRTAFIIPAASLIVVLGDAGLSPRLAGGSGADPETDDPAAYTFPVLCYKAPEEQPGPNGLVFR